MCTAACPPPKAGTQHPAHLLLAPRTHATPGISSSRLLSSSGISLGKKEYRSRRSSSQPPTTHVTACRTCTQSRRRAERGAVVARHAHAVIVEHSAGPSPGQLQAPSAAIHPHLMPLCLPGRPASSGSGLIPCWLEQNATWLSPVRGVSATSCVEPPGQAGCCLTVGV